MLGAAVALCFAAPAWSNPTGPTVVSGSAKFATSGSTLTVTNTPGAIINWQQFSIQPNEVTRFIQQNAASAVLNRVTSGIPSAILGTLSSNGRVYLINASGIAIGRGAMIDVAGFAASTLNLSDADFLAGRNVFRGSGAEGALQNAGSIRTAEGGHVYLVAPKVDNQKDAVITSPKGEVLIAAGRTVELVNAVSPDVRVEFTAAGEAVNAGAIVAASGQVGIYGTLVRNSGLVSASRAVAGAGGRIVFRAAGDALLEEGARVEATGDAGGTIQVLGSRVGVLDGASIDASGDAGGGTVLVGGDFQGKNADVPNAWRTYFGANASIRADALERGEGGRVIVWADDITRAYGRISARGGAAGGNGGFAEVSGKNLLDFDARVDVGAPAGRAGTLLLDPQDIVISNTTTTNNAEVADGAILFGDGGAVNWTISDEALEAQTGNVVLQATRDITLNNNLSGGLNLVNQGPGERVVLQAGRDITVGSPITTAGAAIVLEADSVHSSSGGANGTGTLTINAAVTSNGGRITLIGGGNSILGGGGIALSENQTVDAGAGGIDVALSGNADLGVGSLGLLTQILGNPIDELHTTGALRIGTATTGGSDGLGTGAQTLLADSVTNIYPGSAIDLTPASGTTFEIYAGTGGIVLDQPLTTYQDTVISTTGTLTINDPINTTNNDLQLVAANVVTGANGSINTGTGACTGGGCPVSTIFWDGGGDGASWFDANNWSTNTLPTLADIVDIGAGAMTVVITGGAAAARSVIANRGFTIDATGSLQIAEASQFADLLTLAGGSLLGTGSASVTGPVGAFAWSGGAMAGAGSFQLVSGRSGTLSNALVLDRNFLNEGLLTLSNAAITGSGSFANAGTLTAAAGTTSSIANAFQNISNTIAGTVQVNGTLSFGSFPLNEGTISVAAGGAFSAGTLDNAGTLTVDGAATLGTLSISAGTVGGTGDLTVSTDYLGGAGTLGTTFSDLTLHKAGAFAVPGFTAVDSMKLIASGAVTLNGNVSVTAGSGDSLVISGASFDAGSAVLDPGGGRFLVWSGNPAADDRGTNAYDFKQYNAAYGVSSVLGTGDGFLYTAAPSITPGLTGTVSKGYDAGTSATLTASHFTASGAIDGDTVTLSGTGAYADKNAGTSKAVNATGIAIASATDGSATVYGYQLASTSASANIGEITPAPLTVTADNASKTYGQTVSFAGTEFTSSGLVGGETIGSVTLASLGAAATAGVAGSPYAITASAATGGTFTAGNYSITYNNGSLTISPAALSVTASNASKTYGQTVNFAGTEFTSSGLQNGETIGSVTLASLGAAATANVSGSPYAITASAATGGTFSAGNYTITYNDGALTVSPAALTVTASNASKTYGQTVNFAGTEFSSSGLQNGETIGSVTLASLGTAATAGVAGSPYAITASAATGGTFSSGNYTITYQDGSLTISPAALSVTASNASKNYGQTVTFTGNEFTSSGLQNGETIGSVTLASTGAAPTAGVAGSPYAIAASNATGGTFSAGNYTITYNDGALTISPAALTVTANNAAKTYGQTVNFAGTEFTSSGLQNGETIGSVTLASLGAAATAGVAGSPYAITASAATGGTFASGNYTITYNDGALTISPAALSVTASNASKTYGQTVTFSGTEFTSSGLQNGETIGSVTLASLGAAATANVSGSPYAITASNATGGTFAAGNYSITYNDGSLTISPAALSVTASNASKTYGQTVNFAGTEFTSSGLQNGETIGSVTLASLGAAATANVAGSPYAITASNATGGTFASGNYTITYNDGSLTISPAALTVTASNAAKTYGQTVSFAGTEFTSSGLQNGETIGSVTLASLGAAPTANVSGSPYAITASNATGGTFSSGNYTITYSDGTLTISPAALSVTANNASKTYGQTVNFAGTEFTSSGLQNGETIGSVTLASIGAAPTASVAGGPYAITAANAAGGTFAAGNYTITYSDGTLTISPAALSVTASNASKTYGQTVSFAGTEFTSSGLQNGETIGSVTLASTGAAPTASVAGGPYAITAANAAGGTFAAGNYTITYNNGTLTVSPAALQVAANNASKTYGESLAFAGTEFTATGLQNGETIGAVTLASLGAAPTASVAGGPYAITASNATGGTFSAGNYTITYQDGSLAINPALLTYLADPASRNFGDANPPFSGQVTGFVNGETLATATTGAATWTSLADASSPVGSYAIDGGGLAAVNGNYVFAQAPSNATALTVAGLPPVPPSSLTPPPAPPPPEGSIVPQPTVDTTLLNLNTGESVFVPPNTIPDPGIYLSQDASSVVVVGQSDLGSQLNVASTLLFPVVGYDAGTYVNSETGFVYAVEEGSILDPGVYYNRDQQTVLVVTTNEDGNVTVSSADIKDAVQTVASGAGGRRVVSVACR